MFVQLLITLATIWLFAEALCRLMLGRSVVAAFREVFSPATPGPPAAPNVAPLGLTPGPTTSGSEPNAALRRLLADHRRKLAETGDRLELTEEATEVSEQLARHEAELVLREQRLAELERQRAENAKS